jgi:tetratricopeptide (TPR) repeat protein
MDYLDFVLEIGPAREDVLEVRARSPAGEGRGSLRLPLTAAEPSAGGWLGARPEEGGAGREPLSRDLEATPRPRLTPEDVGGRLFSALFTGEVEALFLQSLGHLSGDRLTGLRIRLVLDPREPALARLQSLPWELMYRARTDDFLGLSRATPIVRSLDVQRAVAPRPLAAKLRVLVVISSPRGLPPLRLDRERSHLREACGRCRVELTFLAQADAGLLREALLKGGFHVLHFMGHGGFEEEFGEGTLYFEAADLSPRPVAGRVLAADLKDVESLRLVVLNACDTARAAAADGRNPFAGVATALVMGGLPAVVAMQAPISDAAAVTFSRDLYRRLAAGDPVEAAVAEGRLAIHRLAEQAAEWATPVLFLRGRDGTLFERRPPSPWKRRAGFAAAGVAALALAVGARSLLRAPQLDSPDVRTAERLVQRGQKMRECQRPILATTAFELALEYDPRLISATVGLADLAIEARDFDTALKHYRQAVAAEPGKAIHHFNLGWLERKLGTPEAIGELQQAIRLDPRYAAAYSELAAAYLDRCLGPEALRTAAAGIARDRDSAPLYRSAGCALVLEKRPAEARDRLLHALGLEHNVEGLGEIRLCLARAYQDLGYSADACDQLAQLERSDATAIRRPVCTQLVSQIDCAPKVRPAQPAGPVPERGPLLDGAPLQAAVAGLAGDVSVVRESVSGLPEVRAAYVAMSIPPGWSVAVAKGAWIEVVCARDTETLVTLPGPVRWRPTPASCRDGRPLLRGSYRRLAPDAGRLVDRGGALLYERQPRGPETDDLSLPVLLSPRDAYVLDPRPVLAWTRAEKAVEYEIEQMQVGGRKARLAVDAVSCGPSREFPGKRDICLTPYPAELPDLVPGAKVALRINVREHLTGEMREGRSPHGVTLMPAERARQVRADLDRISRLAASASARRLLAAGILADNRLYADALRAYGSVLDSSASAAVRVALADVYLHAGLDGFAEAAYRTALTEGADDATRAVTEMGLGAVERRRGAFPAARGHFARAQALYASARLAADAREAGKAARRAAADAAKTTTSGTMR